jgi:preprotein translocase subunit SecA
MSYEHLDSRRRDDQLRGRAGRQGDPGATVVYTSLEDPVYDGLDKIQETRDGKLPYEEATARVFTEKALDRSEAKVNDVLSQSLPYDRTMSGYRTMFYDMRADVLEVSDCRTVVREAVARGFDEAFELYGKPNHKIGTKEKAEELYKHMAALLPLPEGDPPPKWPKMTYSEVRADIDKLVTALFDKRDKAVGEEFARLLERDALITAMDEVWSRFLDDIQDLRAGIGWRAYGQKDPKIEFMGEGAKLFKSTLEEIRQRTAEKLMRKMPKPIAPPPATPPAAPPLPSGK